MGLVGLVVEEVVENFGTSGAAATLAYTGTGYDFFIDSLPFKIAVDDNHPYERATAQFRKDQLDTGQSVGDQSLTGWWTRGQFSFHKGAGVTYYEVSEGETILNRYDDAEGLDPFTPGRVTCQKTWDDYSTSVASVNYVSAIGADLVVLDGTTLKYGDFNGTPTTYVPAGSTTVRAATTSPTLIYAVLANGKVASIDPATDTETTLYTGFTTTARGIWYVKSRLVIADSDGKWYQLATNPTGAPVAIASNDVIFTGIDWASSSSVTDTPGPILIANSNRLFALTLDSTGAIPTFSAPVQVADLPPGETVSAVAYHLGFVVLVTGAGVRVGVLADSGQVTYGPLLVERATATTTPPATSVARYSTRASVVIDNRIIEIDLSQQIGTGLEFAWTGRGEPFSDGATAAGVATIQITTQVAWSNGGLWTSTANALEGYLQTGLHRYATLEPKRFLSVRVHCEGTSGEIAVSKISAAGVETSLYTIDVAQEHVKEIDLREPDGIEALGLKFTLIPAAGAPTVSPILLGYQIRALPDPQRQRMIRVPLEMKDIERRLPARSAGRTGSAYSRLAALEALEESAAVVTFADLRTGETGTALVEAVEFTNLTPPSNTSTGFGGRATVTLRRI